MVKVEHENFSVKQIARSGQCFRLNEIETGVFEVIAYGKRLHIIQEKDNGPVALCCSRQEYETLWKRYFDLETNYRYYIDHIDPDDHFLSRAVQAGGGIRILRQELWETMVSFIISQNNSIPRIKKSIESLCVSCGIAHGELFEGRQWYEFPSPESLLDEEAMAPAKLGYRAKYIASLARNVVDGVVNLEDLAAMGKLSSW